MTFDFAGCMSHMLDSMPLVGAQYPPQSQAENKAAISKRCLEHIRQAKGRGLTRYELARKSSAFKALPGERQKEILRAMQAQGQIELREMRRARGPARLAWVAI